MAGERRQKTGRMPLINSCQAIGGGRNTAACRDCWGSLEQEMSPHCNPERGRAWSTNQSPAYGGIVQLRQEERQKEVERSDVVVYVSSFEVKLLLVCLPSASPENISLLPSPVKPQTPPSRHASLCCACDLLSSSFLRTLRHSKQPS